MRGETDPDYLTLTSLLHWKSDSAGIKQNDLDKIFVGVFGGEGTFGKKNEAVVDMIFREATDCLSMTGGVNLENKVLLAIAIRLAAEHFMSSEIRDPVFLSGIKQNQTPSLLKRFAADLGHVG